MGTGAYQSYLENEVLTSDPLQLVRLLYRGALDAISGARLNQPERNRLISKAIAIVGELNRTLDMNRGGHLALQLSSLYNYILSRLAEARLKQSDELLVEPEQLLETLFEGWRQCEWPMPVAGHGAGTYGTVGEAGERAVDYAW